VHLAYIDDSDTKAKSKVWQVMAAVIIEDQTFTLLEHALYSIRKDLLPSPGPGNELLHFHDDMYFGDSRFSIGIQLADLCAYFIARHLEGDLEIQGFYEMVSPHIVFSQVHPNVPEAWDPLPEAKEKSDEAKP